MNWVMLMLCCLMSCERESSAGLIILDTQDSASHSSTNPTIQFMDSSYLRANIRAGWAKMYDKHAETLLGGGINVEFYAKPSRALASILTADSARIDDKSKDMTASGNVVVISQGNFTTVKTSVMQWDSSRQVLHSTAFVDIRSPYELLQGYGFESDADLHHYTIYKVTGQTLLSPNGEPMTNFSTSATSAANTSIGTSFSTSAATKSPSAKIMTISKPNILTTSTNSKGVIR
jgi:LPS export ABC transporter protein LptC